VVGGVWAFIHPIGLIVYLQGACCFWPFLALEPIWGVVAMVRGFQIFFARPRPRIPLFLVLSQIHLSGCFDLANCLLGVLNLLMLCAPNTRRYFRNEWGE